MGTVMCDTPTNGDPDDTSVVDVSVVDGSFEDVRDHCLFVSDEELVAAVRAKELERRRVEAELAAMTAVLEHRGRYPDGHLSLKAFLKANLNMSGISGHRQRQISRLVSQFPQVGHAWHAGELGRDQVVELARLWHHRTVRECFPGFVDQLLDAAVRFEFDEFMLVIQRFMLGADPDGAHEDRDTAIEGRNARIVVNGGQLDASIVGGDPLVAQEIKCVFEYYCDLEFAADLAARKAEYGDLAEGQPFPRTARQRRFDAFVAMVRAAGTNTGADTSRPVADFVVNVVMDQQRFDQLLSERNLIDNMDGTIDSRLHTAIDACINQPLDGISRCETQDGQPIHPHDALRAALTGHVRRVLVDSRSVVIDMGRKQRLFTGSARTAATLLVNRCQHPGCDIPIDWCQLDHNQPWVDLGDTNQHNAGQPCPVHHKTKERLGLRCERDIYGHRRTKRPDGTYLLATGMPPPITNPTADNNGQPPVDG